MQGVDLAVAEPPRVLHVTPDLGDVDVDPGLKEVRVEFDQDMRAGSNSICGGGPLALPVSAKPTWESARVCIIPVKLEPGHEYSFSLNCPAARNFVGANGEAAIPYSISMKTLVAGRAARTLNREENAAAVKELRRVIDEVYSYRDLRGVDWNGAIERDREALEASTTRGEFARGLVRLLVPAKDIHLRVVVDGLMLGTNREPGPRTGFDGRKLAKSAPGLVRHNDRVTTAFFPAGEDLDGGIGYARIDSWSDDNGEAELRPLFDALAQWKEARGIIIDVRLNGGGSEPLARTVAACFVEKRFVYSKHRVRKKDAPDGWSEIGDRVIRPRPDGPLYTGKVAVLIGPGCVSSNESFILMMRGAPKQRSFGSTTRGSSGNPRRFDLGNGVSLSVPTWQDLLPDGTVLEGRGITPDEPGLDGAAETDRVVDAAIEWIRAAE